MRESFTEPKKMTVRESLTKPEGMTVRKSLKRGLALAALVVLACACFFSFVLSADAESRRETPRKKNYSSSGAASAPGPSVVSWTNQETDYRVLVEDDADLLDESGESQLALEMQAITAYGNAAFKSLSYNSSSASAFARDYYHRQFGTASGTLFLIDMDNREIYIFSDGAVYQTITTAYANTITDNVYRYASSGDYLLCASTAFEQIHTLLSGRKIAQPMKYISNALLALILAALINYFVVRVMSHTPQPSSREILASASTRFSFTNPRRRLTKRTKVYHPPTGSGGGHGGGGGGSHSGGGGGGSSSGGGGGHRF